jgi:hypothetical protein
MPKCEYEYAAPHMYVLVGDAEKIIVTQIGKDAGYGSTTFLSSSPGGAARMLQIR